MFIRNWFFDILTVLGFILGALGVYFTIESDKPSEVLQNNLIIGLGGSFLFSAGIAYHYFHKSSILGANIKGRDDAQMAIHRLYLMSGKKIVKTTIQSDLKELNEICQLISGSMRRFHTPTISVCIQYVKQDNNKRPYVDVLCRNTESHNRAHRSGIPGKEIDYIDENTDFKSIYNCLTDEPLHKIYYLNNFLQYTPYYRNTHFTSNRMKNYYGKFGYFYKMFKWELPYKSTLVVPLLEENGRKRDLVGFISIDSPISWSFSKDYDVPIVLHIAKSLCPIVKRFAQQNLVTSK